MTPLSYSVVVYTTSTPTVKTERIVTFPWRQCFRERVHRLTLYVYLSCYNITGVFSMRFGLNFKKQDYHCTYYVILKRVPATIIAVEK